MLPGARGPERGLFIPSVPITLYMTFDKPLPWAPVALGTVSCWDKITFEAQLQVALLTKRRVGGYGNTKRLGELQQWLLGQIRV